MLCIICYYQISNNEVDNQTQIQKCGKCHKSFHIHCITRWLKNNQTCPLCRNFMITLHQQIIDDVNTMCNIQ